MLKIILIDKTNVKGVINDIKVGDVIHKRESSTGKTRGRVLAIDGVSRVPYNIGGKLLYAYYENQIKVEMIADQGDSQAL